VKVKSRIGLLTKGAAMFALPASRRQSHAQAEQHRILTGGVGTRPKSSLPGFNAEERNLFSLQAKLVVGRSDDPLEHEADRVADHVMRMSDPAANRYANAPKAAQRKCAACEEAEQLAKRGTDPDVAKEGRATPGSVTESLASPGRPLDSATRAFFEPRFGRDFSQVRVHDDDRANKSAHAIGALAYTVGSNIAFAAGNYGPGTDAGRSLLAHELTHVAQQSGPSGAGVLPESTGTTAQIVRRQDSPAPDQDTAAPQQASATGQKSYFQCVNDTLASMGIASAISELVWAGCGVLGVAAGVLGTLVEPGGGTLTGWGLAVASCVAFATGCSVGKVVAAMVQCA
jgi:Domain of unknown function (DUF4157)